MGDRRDHLQTAMEHAGDWGVSLQSWEVQGRKKKKLPVLSGKEWGVGSCLERFEVVHHDITNDLNRLKPLYSLDSAYNLVAKITCHISARF